MTVPPYELQQEDSYLCVAKLLPPNPHKLIGVIPRAEQKVTHHILIYGERGVGPVPHLLPAPGPATNAQAWGLLPTPCQPFCTTAAVRVGSRAFSPILPASLGCFASPPHLVTHGLRLS